MTKSSKFYTILTTLVNCNGNVILPAKKKSRKANILKTSETYSEWYSSVGKLVWKSIGTNWIQNFGADKRKWRTTTNQECSAGACNDEGGFKWTYRNIVCWRSYKGQNGNHPAKDWWSYFILRYTKSTNPFFINLNVMS